MSIIIDSLVEKIEFGNRVKHYCVGSDEEKHSAYSGAASIFCDLIIQGQQSQIDELTFENCFCDNNKCYHFHPYFDILIANLETAKKTHSLWIARPSISAAAFQAFDLLSSDEYRPGNSTKDKQPFIDFSQELFDFNLRAPQEWVLGINPKYAEWALEKEQKTFVTVAAHRRKFLGKRYMQRLCKRCRELAFAV